MRLTQTALRPADLEPRPETNTVDDRLERLERRLAIPATAQIDQKVLEAVVGAVDARIREHAVQVERRMADLEAKFVLEFQSLYHQDRQAGETAEKNLADVQEQFRQDSLALRMAVTQDLSQFAQTVSKVVADQVAARSELQTLHQQNERILDSAEQRFAAMDARLHGLEQSLEARIVTAAAAQADEHLAPLRAEARRKEQELVELRQRLTDSERAVLDVVLSIGQVCRQAADRLGGQAAPVAMVESLPAPQIAEEPSLSQAEPDFLSEANGNQSWRIPLVSSFLVMTTAGLALMHYL